MDLMEKSRLRLKRLRKLSEQIKIEEKDYYEKYGDDVLKLVLLKNSKMEFERYDRRNTKPIDQRKIKFDFFKYFIEKGAHRLAEHALQESTLFYQQFAGVIRTHFKNEDYVTIVSNKHERYLEENRIIFEAFSKKKKGRLTYAENDDSMETEYMIQVVTTLSKGVIRISNKQCRLDQLVYVGSHIEGENVLLLGDEFGLDDALGNLLIQMKPKRIINILNNDKYSWFDNVD